jgi:zinc protease
MPMQLAAGLFPIGGLGKMDITQIATALANSTWMFSMEPQATGFVLSSSTLSDSVGQQMRVLTAFMTDPGFRPQVDEKLPTALDFGYRMMRTDPTQVAQDALEHAVFPGKESMPPRELITAYHAPDFERMLRPILTRSPIEVTVVGDITEEEATEAVASTFAALPPRPPLPPPPPGSGPFRTFPESLPAPVTATHEGPVDKAAAILAWPLYVATPERRREEYAIGLLRSILETRLLHQVRVVMGKVYSPSVTSQMIDQADQGALIATLEARPEEIVPLVAAARAVAAELAAGKISQEELDAARTPILASSDQSLRDNAAWAAGISHTVREPDALRELTGFHADLEAVTLDDVRRAAATWLTPTPMLVRALPGRR